MTELQSKFLLNVTLLLVRNTLRNDSIWHAVILFKKRAECTILKVEMIHFHMRMHAAKSGCTFTIVSSTTQQNIFFVTDAFIKTLTPICRYSGSEPSRILQNPPVHFWKHASLIFKMHSAFSLIFHIQHLLPVLLAR